jgi:pyruvate dehydrogenase E1 component alpha subunit
VGPEVDADIGFRTRKDIEFWMQRCPIEGLRKQIRESGHGPDPYARLEQSVLAEIEEAIQQARRDAYPREVPA